MVTPSHGYDDYGADAHDYSGGFDPAAAPGTGGWGTYTGGGSALTPTQGLTNPDQFFSNIYNAFNTPVFNPNFGYDTPNDYWQGPPNTPGFDQSGNHTNFGSPGIPGPGDAGGGGSNAISTEDYQNQILGNFANFQQAGLWGANQAQGLMQDPGLYDPRNRMYQLEGQIAGGGNNAFTRGMRDFNPNNAFGAGLANMDTQNPLTVALTGINTANPYQNSLGGFRANNPFANDLGGVNTANPLQGKLANFDASNPLSNRLANTDASNPFQSDLQNFDASNNFAGQLAQVNTGNPFTQGFQNFQSQANPFADQLHKIGADKIRDRINSQFGASGQGNSALNLDTQLADLSDYTSQFYGNIYDSQQNRALDALSRGADASNRTAGLNIDALLGAGGLSRDATNARLNALTSGANTAATSTGQGIDALLGAGGLTRDSSNTNLNALTSGADVYGRGVGQQIDSLSNAGNIWGNAANTQLNALGMGADAFSTGTGQKLNALLGAGDLYGQGVGQQINAFGKAGDLYGAGEGRQLDALNMGADATNRANITAGTYLPSILQNPQEQQWGPLRNYADIVAALSGTQPQPRNKSSGFDQGLGLLSLIGGFL